MEELDLIVLMKEFWKKRKLIIIIFCCTAFILTTFLVGSSVRKNKNNTSINEKSTEIEKKYVSSISFLIWEKEDENKENIINNNDEKENSQNLMAALIKSDAIVKKISDDLDLPLEKEYVIVSNDVKNLINVSVVYDTQEDAIKIANEIIEKVKERIKEDANFDKVNIDIINSPENSCEEYEKSDLKKAEKTTGTTTSSKSMIKKLFIVVFISGIASFGTVFVIFIFDNKVKTAEQIEKEVGMEVLDTLEKKDNKNDSIENELTTIFDFKSKNSKIFKVIAAKVLSKIEHDGNIVQITSANPKEGKTYAASNLGTVLSMFGNKVIIVDCNFENPMLDKIFKVPNSLGLSNYLTGMNVKGQEIKETLNNFIQETDIKNLNIITAGNIKENITNCLVSDRFEEFIKQLKFYYDFIIFDSEPVLFMPNTLVLSQKSDYSLFIVDKDSTKAEDLIKAKKDIESVGGKIIGVILNETNRKTKFASKKYTIFSKNKLLEENNK